MPSPCSRERILTSPGAHKTVLCATILRRARFTPGRRGATARKKRSGTSNDQHRCLESCPDSEIGIAVPLRIRVRQRTCVKNGPAVCQAQGGPTRTKQFELHPPERAVRSKARAGSSAPAAATRGLPNEKGSGRSRSLGLRRAGRASAPLATAAYGWTSAPKAPRITPRLTPWPKASPVSVHVPMMPSGPSWSWPTNMPSSCEPRAAMSSMATFT